MDGGLTEHRAVLIERRNRLDETRRRIISDTEAAGRKFLDPRATRRFKQTTDEIEALTARIDEMTAEIDRCGMDSPVVARILKKEQKMEIRDRDSGTYRQHGPNSYIRDLCNVTLMRDYDGQSRDRLTRHAADVAQEHRAIDRTDGSGGYAVPPAWLISQYVELARPGRAFANLCTTQPLPSGADSINVPKLATGTTTAFQTADNANVSNTDLTDTFVSAPVKTIAGEQDVALQLIDQSPINFDQVVVNDLVAAHAATLDQAVISSDGSGNRILGVHSTASIQTLTVSAPTLPAVYSGIADAIQRVHNARYLAPDAIVMHPRRWGWLLSLLDDQKRPLFAPAANALNPVGVLQNVASQQVVGQMQGLPIVTDPNIPTNFGGGNNQDPIYVARFSDIHLYESGLRARVMPQTLGRGLTVVIQIYSYVAFTAGRFPQSVVEVQGLTTPTFTSS
ncbi:phage major capsid protein [Mycobacterium persicum]|uniref:phage major capsid protein n=1 Tax=Mycobacterium persicum TaxID=1487726 RepID=UPI0013C37820|nr:phage major capsid protein [Mycobacterium persicum]